MTRDVPLSEGDVNVSPARAEWRAGLSEQARAALDEDERYFLRQSLSTPCLTEIVRAEGAWLTDVDGRRILDFHGNSVHQLGHGHPRVVEAIRREMETLPFCTAPLFQPDRDGARPSAGRNGAGGARQDSVRAERIGGGRHGAEARALRHRPAQDAVVLGFVPRRDARRDRRRRRSSVPPRPRADDSGRRTPAAARPRAPLLRRRSSVRPPRRLHRLFARRSGRRRGADRRAAALDDGHARRRPNSGRACASPARGTGRC